jgi:hypothetical protein
VLHMLYSAACKNARCEKNTYNLDVLLKKKTKLHITYSREWNRETSKFREGPPPPASAASPYGKARSGDSMRLGSG